MSLTEPTKSQKDGARRRAAKLQNMGRDAKGEFPWRNSKQIAGMEGILQRAVNNCEDGATVTLDITSARNLLEIVRQAKHTEVGHGV